MKSTRILGRILLAAIGLSLAGTGAFASGTHYYVNDHLATTVGIADAAGEIAALEADAFGSPLAGGTNANAGRYTGKPYDEDMGAYVFPFRNYRAEEGRWMTADPSGFPDGVNGSFYAPVPTTGIDSLGLAEWREIRDTRDDANTDGFLLDRATYNLWVDGAGGGIRLWDIDHVGFSQLSSTPQVFYPNDTATGGMAFSSTITLQTQAGGDGFTVGVEASFSSQASNAITVGPTGGYEKYRVTWYAENIRYRAMNVSGTLENPSVSTGSFTSAQSLSVYYRLEGYE